KFKMRRVVLLPEPPIEQGQLFPERYGIPLVVKELQETGLSAHDAWEIAQQRFGYVHEQVRPAAPVEDVEEAFLHYIREKIHLLKRKQASSKVDNSTGFLLQAIRQNYANPEFAQELHREAVAAKQRATQERVKQVQALEQQKTHLQKAHEK